MRRTDAGSAVRVGTHLGSPVGVLAVWAAMAGVAVAQGQTEVRYEARVFDPGHDLGWASAVNALPGDHIEIRAVVTYFGDASPVALGQVIFQPTVRHVLASDAVIGTPGTPGDIGIGPLGGSTTTPPGHVPNAPGAYGRLTPWAATVTTTSTFLRGHTHTVDGVSVLRIARSDVTNWIGDGPTSGAGAINNTSGGGGVSIAQGNVGPARPTNFPPPVLGTEGLVVFKFGMVLGGDGPPRTLVVTTPHAPPDQPPGPGQMGFAPQARWFSSLADATPGSIVTTPYAVDALIHVVPSPGAGGAWLAFGVLAFSRSRRRAGASRAEAWRDRPAPAVR